MTFDPSSRVDVERMMNARAVAQERAMNELESRRRSAAEMAQYVAEEAVSLMTAEHPDVFRGRNVSGLVSLIRGWIMGGE